MADGRDGRRAAGRRDRAEDRHRRGRPQPLLHRRRPGRQGDLQGRVRGPGRALCAATGSPTRSSPTTASASPGGSVLSPSRCCSTGSAARTASRHRHTAVRSPTTTGKIERFHQSLRTRVPRRPTFASIERPRPSSMRGSPTTTPFGRTRPWRWPRRPSGSGWPARQGRRHRSRSIGRGRPRGQWVLRRVGSNGMVSVDNQLFSVGNAYRGELSMSSSMRPLIQVWSKTT